MKRGGQRPGGRGSAPPTGFPEAFTNSFRGMLLGGLLGDVRNPGGETLHSGPVSQQTCWTLDALIRHRLRLRELQRVCEPAGKPLPAPTDDIRRGLLHWGALARQWPNPQCPDGWLSGVPALATDRGSTPAEDDAREDLLAERPLSRHDSRSSSALFRTLPLAASAVTTGPDVVAGWCAGTAALTHGHPESWTATSLLGILVGSHLAEIFRRGPWVTLDFAAAIEWFTKDQPGEPVVDHLRTAATTQGWSPATLHDLAPDDTSAAVLAGALYLFRHAQTAPLHRIRLLAASAGSPHAVASLATALVGLEQGPGGLDTGELSRHELTWVVDALARDYCVTLWSPPAHEGEMDVLDEMSERYPRER